MKKALVILVFWLMVASQSASAETLQNTVFQEQPGATQAVILAGKYIDGFKALDKERFDHRRSTQLPLKLILAKVGPRTLKVACRDIYGGQQDCLLEADVKPDRIYRVDANETSQYYSDENGGGVSYQFYISLNDITDQGGPESVANYITERLTEENDATNFSGTIGPIKMFGLDAIFTNLKKENTQNRNRLMSLATLNPKTSAAYNFAQAMLEPTDDAKREGLSRVIQQDAIFLPAYYEQGKLAFKHNQYDDVLTQMEAVIRLNSDCAMAYMYEGYAMFKLNRPDAEVEAAFAKAARTNQAALLIVSELQTKRPDEIFDEYNVPNDTSSLHFVLHGSISSSIGSLPQMSQPDDPNPNATTSNFTGYNFGAAMDMVNLILVGLEVSRNDANINDPLLNKTFLQEYYEAGVYAKFTIPIGSRFMASLGFGGYTLWFPPQDQAEVMPDSYAENITGSFKFMTGMDYFITHNLAAGIDVGIRLAIPLERERTLSDVQEYQVPSNMDVDLSGFYVEIGLKWYAW